MPNFASFLRVTSMRFLWRKAGAAGRLGEQARPNAGAAGRADGRALPEARARHPEPTADTMAKVIHTMVRVLDLDKSLRFYADVLDLHEAHRPGLP